MSVFVVLCIFLALLIINYCLTYVRSRHRYFKRNNVPGPDATFLFGHLNILCTTNSYSRQLQSWTQQFGSVYGIFEGAQPIWVSSNVDFLYEVYIKHFSCFNARKPEMLTRNTDNVVVHLFDAKGRTWKRQRCVCIPLFASTKIQDASTKIRDCIDQLASKLHQKLNHNEQFDIMTLYQQFAFDASCRQAFGSETESMSQNYNTYLSKCKGTSINIQHGLLAKFDSLFPEFASISARLFRLQNTARAKLNRWFSRSEATNTFREQPAFWLMGSIRRIVDNQNMHGQTSDCILESLRAMSNRKLDEDIADSTVLHKYIKKDEIVNNLLLFLLAGTDTISAALSYCTYVLAKYPAEQERVYENIVHQSTGDDPFDPRCVKSMDYLDFFIRETLRLYPVSITAMSRQCTSDCAVLNYAIRRGDGIQPDVYTIHHDIRLWGPVHPDRFYPDRFRTKRHPMAWLPFGAGPRMCVGVKLALIEIKLVLVDLVRLYRFHLNSNDDSQLNIKESFVLAPKELRVRLEDRAK